MESVESLRRLVAFYVREHNEVMPHAAFEGQTPDEMFFGGGATVSADLTARRAQTREERIQANRAAACGICRPEANFRALQTQRPRSRMS